MKDAKNPYNNAKSLVQRVLETATSIENGRSKQDVLIHAMSELGEIADAIKRPERQTEPLQNEIADCIICLIDLLYIHNQFDCRSTEQELDLAIDTKLAKWRSYEAVSGINEKSTG